ncbi:MAG: hypothetical protein LUQ22_09295 [Methanotrichaceae archaeon]|nr:hypothetical protein [Methanotrichaceae archaeon]
MRSFNVLQKKERLAEDKLSGQKLTRQHAKQFYNGTAGCTRALLDFRIYSKKEQPNTKLEAAGRKMDIARTWNMFISNSRMELIINR